jgi:hypothetical protein
MPTDHSVPCRSEIARLARRAASAVDFDATTHPGSMARNYEIAACRGSSMPALQIHCNEVLSSSFRQNVSRRNPRLRCNHGCLDWLRCTVQMVNWFQTIGALEPNAVPARANPNTYGSRHRSSERVETGSKPENTLQHDPCPCSRTCNTARRVGPDTPP